jgi:methionine-rich copper-binding protein CopC
MIRNRFPFVLLVIAGLVAFGTTQVHAEEAVRHITLESSSPKDGETVSSDLKEIRLFFSGAPLLRGASIRIVSANRSLIRSTPPAADPNDPKQLFVEVEQTLAPGSYVIQWRCIADDGHVMRGDFRFRVE